MNDLEYYRRRMRQEEDAAKAATRPQARECHEQLAAAYAFRCRMLQRQQSSAQDQRAQGALVLIA